MPISKKFTISVVAPAHNEGVLISALLEALLKQTVLPDEVIIVNNASTDDTEQKIEAFIPRFKEKNIYLRVLDEPIKGVARARNTGFFTATGDILASIDADCSPDEQWIKHISRCFAEKDCHIVRGKVIMADAPLPIYLLTKWGWYKWYYQFLQLISGHTLFSGGNFAVKKEIFIQSGGFNNQIVDINGLDDLEFAKRLNAITEKFHYEPKMIIHTSFRRYNNIRESWYHLYQRSRNFVKIFYFK